MTRPSDIPPWAWDAAGDMRVSREAIARALLSAKREGMERAAAICERSGSPAVTSRVADLIRQAAKEAEQ